MCARLLFFACLGLFFTGPARAAEWKVTARAPLAAVAPLSFSAVSLASADRRAEIHLLPFRSDQFRLELVDNPLKARSLEAAATARGAVAGVNGGYFDPANAALGLRVSLGQTLHAQQRAQLLSGILFTTAKGQIFLQRPSVFRLQPTVREAIQAGPYLVEAGKPIAGLNATRDATRTVVLLGPDHHAALALCRGVTLAEMAEILVTPELLPFAVQGALNLDGGSSSALWVAGPAGKSAFYAREFKSVRDFVVIVPGGAR